MILQPDFWFVFIRKVTKSTGKLISLPFLSVRRISKKIRQPVSRVYFHESGSFKTILLIEGDSTVKNCFAGHASGADKRGILWTVGRIQRI